MDDRAAVAAQLGRQPRSEVRVVARCHLGLPVVIEVPPHLDDGTPFPTTFWLTCPLARRRIGRLEAAGGVKVAEARLASDPEFRARHEAAAERYATARDDRVSADVALPRPVGGVGGAIRGVKCLHAHYADYRAENDNPVGQETGEQVGLLDCSDKCVRPAADGCEPNPDWHEPRR